VGTVTAVLPAINPSFRRVAVIWKFTPTGRPSGATTWPRRRTLGGQERSRVVAWKSETVCCGETAGVVASTEGTASIM